MYPSWHAVCLTAVPGPKYTLPGWLCTHAVCKFAGSLRRLLGVLGDARMGEVLHDRALKLDRIPCWFGRITQDLKASRGCKRWKGAVVVCTGWYKGVFDRSLHPLCATGLHLHSLLRAWGSRLQTLGPACAPAGRLVPRIVRSCCA
jgi:hypothetical protein